MHIALLALLLVVPLILAILAVVGVFRAELPGWESAVWVLVAVLVPVVGPIVWFVVAALRPAAPPIARSHRDDGRPPGGPR